MMTWQPLSTSTTFHYTLSPQFKFSTVIIYGTSTYGIFRLQVQKSSKISLGYFVVKVETNLLVATSSMIIWTSFTTALATYYNDKYTTNTVSLSFGMYSTCIPNDHCEVIPAAASLYISNCYTD